jgi:aldehyde dehydrogenase (NAD+)
MMPSTEEKAVSGGIEELFSKQKRAILAGPEPLINRKRRLRSLASWIKANQPVIQQGIYADFRKPEVEVQATEIYPVLAEIDHVLDQLDRWVKPKKIDAPFTMLGTRSFVAYEPKGVCLIISPWNYPFNLAIGPLVCALAAGNRVVLKPSEITPHTSAVIGEMCRSLFEDTVVAVCEGGPEVSEQLLKLPFDHIFFTGSPSIGKVVMKAAAENLSSVTLELGGKSPTIVTPTAKLKDAAKRIAVAKFINNGQTCIAPDYIMVHQSVVTEFISRLKIEVIQLFSDGGKPLQESPHYARVVNDKHFSRVNACVQDALERGATIELSGPVDPASRFIHPMILTQVPDNARLMEEEIFGPVLPVLTYDSLDEAINRINQRPKPLALYLFTSSKKEQRKVLERTSSGGVCINDCAIHFLHPYLPFGGVNNSGIGKSHGYFGFLAFSNEKAVVRQRNGITSFQLFYPPYTARVKRMMNWFIKLF